ncbi:hydrogenase expression/formation protein HypE, partial [Patescibacteria group bacterium]
LFKKVRQAFPQFGKWQGQDADAAVLSLGKKKLVFTTDSYVVSPLFFPGGNIGKLAICGTINDLSVMGAKPLGISLGLIIEEGFSQKNLQKILKSITNISRREKIPVVTGDTKVMNKGKVDGLVVNTSGVGEADRVIKNEGLKAGDKIIVSGSIGDHGAALLAKRFDYQTNLKSDCQPIWSDIKKIKSYLTACKDPTRGGLSAVMHEMARKGNVKIVLNEAEIPVKKESEAICEMLGISLYDLASEGRFVAGVKPRNLNKVLGKIKQARVIGEVAKGKGVFLQTKIGTRTLSISEGKLVPRIC